jgi:hypothetical protein
MSFFKFSAILYAFLWLIERFWPLLLALVIYYMARQWWKEFKRQRDG